MNPLRGAIVGVMMMAWVLAPAARGEDALAERFADPALPQWTRNNEKFVGVRVADGRAVLNSDRWAELLSKRTFGDVAISANVTIVEPAKTFGFAGASWTVWTDFGRGDGGYEGAILFRVSEDGQSFYRVQLSSKYQEVTLGKWPMGSFVRVAPCAVTVGKSHHVEIEARGATIVVKVDGAEKIRYADEVLPLEKGRVGLAVSSGAKVAYADVDVRALDGGAVVAEKPAAHRVDFRLRQWRGRPWVFDGDEPILLVATPAAGVPCHQNAKLRPGLKPLLMWNALWDLANQGAYKEADSKISEAAATGGGETLTLDWKARHVKDAFEVSSHMTVSWDPKRAVYVYDVASGLEMLPDQTFTFRYGFDFEHHTALDPFRWENLLLKSADGKMLRRPLTPFDSGPIYDLAQGEGFRAWVGRRGEPFVVGPVVEYDISGSAKRKMNTAVCAWAYDTGVGYPQETLKGGDKIEVRYRYTGAPATELLALRDKAQPPPQEATSPNRHFIFADTFPRIDFSEFASLADAWAYGRVPFLSGHNAVPAYSLAKGTGFHGGFAMRIGPGGHAAANLAIKQALPAGRYVVSAWAKADNLLGPGARMELLLLKETTGAGYVRQNQANMLKSEPHWLGVGSWGWRRVGFVSALAGGAKNLAIEFANPGTGEVLFTDFEIAPLADGAAIPDAIAAAPNIAPAPLPAKPAGAMADYRMMEGKGLVVFDHAGGQFGMLGLANLDWVTDDGRPALRFADNLSGRREFGGAAARVVTSPSNKGRDNVPVAIAGDHGGGFPLNAFTISAFIKPAAEMGRSDHGGKGDVVGLGARRFILGLAGQKAPYQLTARLNVNDTFTATQKLEADRWYHIALTGVPSDNGRWSVKLLIDGKVALEGESKKFAAPTSIPPSIILGAELFYLHDAYYRGLIGRVTVLDRAAMGEELAAIAPK